MKKQALAVVDLVVGVPLMMLAPWPVRIRRRIAGPGTAWRVIVSWLFLLLWYVVLVETAVRGVRLISGKPTSPSWHYVDDRYLYDDHPFRAVELKPGARYVYGVGGYTGDVEYRINEHGCRGPALDPPDADRPRILCLGGSVTFGLDLAEDETWPAQLQRLLPDSSVMNCGVSGYMSRNIVSFAQGSLLDLEPDLLVLYVGRNDLHANEVFHPESFSADYSHMYSPRRLPEGLKKWLIRHSWICLTLARWTQDIGSAFLRMRNRSGAGIETFGPRGVAAYRRNIEDLIALAERRDVRVLLASEAPGYYPLKLADGSANPHLDTLARDTGHCPPEVYRKGLERYGDVLKATGAPYADTVRELTRDPSLYIDSVHLSAAGCEAVARMLAPRVRALLKEPAK